MLATIMEELLKTIKKLALENQDLKSQLNGLIKVDPVINLEAMHAFDTYETRANIQKTVTKHNSISGWDNLLPNLRKLSNNKDSYVSLLNITGEDFGLMFFLNKKTNENLGVLKFLEQKVNPTQELDSKENLRGTWTNGTTFYYQENRKL